MESNLSYSYDDESDVLYAFWGSPKPAYCEEMGDGVLVRRDIKTNKVVGVTIYDFKGWLLMQRKEIHRLDRDAQLPLQQMLDDACNEQQVFEFWQKTFPVLMGIVCLGSWIWFLYSGGAR